MVIGQAAAAGALAAAGSRVGVAHHARVGGGVWRVLVGRRAVVTVLPRVLERLVLVLL